VPFSRLHAKPKALYKAVVDATTDDERAAAVAALEEYEGSNGVCYACRVSCLKDPEKQKKKKPTAPPKCSDPFGKGCRNPDPAKARKPCPVCATMEKLIASLEKAAPS
jgi:hypothetical protein